MDRAPFFGVRVNLTETDNPLLAIANCTLNAAYVEDLNNETRCVCKSSYSGKFCENEETTAPLIDLIATQIILGAVLALVLLCAVAILITSILGPQNRKKNILRIMAAAGVIVGIAFKFVWVVDGFKSNEFERRVPRTAGIFCFWVSDGFFLFSFLVIVGFWAEMLSSKLAVFRIKYAPRLAVGIGIAWTVVAVGFQALQVGQIPHMDIVSGVYAAATLITVTVVSLVMAVKVVRRMKESSGLKSYGNQHTRDYALRVARLFYYLPVPVVSFMIIVSMSNGYDSIGDEQPVLIVRAVLTAAQLVCEIGMLIMFLAMLIRRPLWVEIGLAFRLIRDRSSGKSSISSDDTAPTGSKGRANSVSLVSHSISATQTAAVSSV